MTASDEIQKSRIPCVRFGFTGYRRVVPRRFARRVRARARRGVAWRGTIDGGGSTGRCQCKLVGLHGNQPTSSSRRPCSSYSTYRGRRKREDEAGRVGRAEGGDGAVDQEVRKTEARGGRWKDREGRKRVPRMTRRTREETARAAKKNEG